MRSINIYWSIRERVKRRERRPFPGRRSVRNRPIALECMAAAAVMAAAEGVTCGAYPLLPGGFERTDSGELKLKMCWNELVIDRSGGDA